MPTPPAPSSNRAPDTTGPNHIAILDGWRAVSILLVLASHLLPLGPSKWGLNATAGAMGMALFFTLSGFLMTRYFWQEGNVVEFLIRRVMRIVPLAWAGLLAVALISAVPDGFWFANLLFLANLPPQHLVEANSHYWSLGVEVQFYGGLALISALFGRRGLYLLPLVAIVVTGLRIHARAPIDIVTWLRVDEILAGGLIALCYEGAAGSRLLPGPVRAGKLVALLSAATLVASHPAGGFMLYLRPYLAAALVYTSFSLADSRARRVLESRPFRYLAAISYALYVIHGILRMTWLGSGTHWVERYAKRPLLFAVLFASAHVSTFQFERRFIDLGHRWVHRYRSRRSRSDASGAPP